MPDADPELDRDFVAQSDLYSYHQPLDNHIPGLAIRCAEAFHHVPQFRDFDYGFLHLSCSSIRSSLDSSMRFLTSSIISLHFGIMECTGLRPEQSINGKSPERQGFSFTLML